VLIGASGELLSSAETHVERNLSSLQEFLKIVIVSILPSLFDRPRASLDWLELARSMIEITDREGWAVANRYLVDLLNDRVPTRTAFNAFDHQLLQTVRTIVPHPQAAAGAGGAARPAPAQGVYAGGACRDWNGGICKKDAAECRWLHRCLWSACTNPSDGHRGKDCVHKSGGFTPRQAPGSGGHRGAGRPPAGAPAASPRK
jgi:hypothetical protein